MISRGLADAELLVDKLLHCRVVAAEAALALVAVAVLASGHRFSEGVVRASILAEGLGQAVWAFVSGIGADLVPLIRPYQYWARAM